MLNELHDERAVNFKACLAFSYKYTFIHYDVGDKLQPKHSNIYKIEFKTLFVYTIRLSKTYSAKLYR